MLSRFLALPRLLARWDEQAVPSLLMRAGLALLLFRPWEIRFRPSAVPMSEIDPALLELGRSQGVNLLDASAWPTIPGLLLRLGVLWALLFLVLWGYSRLRRWLASRFGAGLGTLALLTAVWVAAFYLAVQRGGVPTGPFLFLGLFSPVEQGVPLWGGWLEGSVFHWWGVQLLLPMLMLIAGGVELLYLLLHGRLALLEAQDGALRARLAPHFLFNALNTLHAQIETEPATAQETTERLAGLFRQVLEVTEQPTVPLSRELAFVEDYLGIERVRLGDRLKVVVEVTEAAAAAAVPVLGLQVLVENAIKHGVEPRVVGGTVRIEARMEGRRLWVSVTDPGGGVPQASKGTGRALANLRARLSRPGDLVLEPVDGGFRAMFTFAQGTGGRP